MVAIFDSKLEGIIAVCHRHGVAHLYAFGSALRDDFRTGESDVDLLHPGGTAHPSRLLKNDASLRECALVRARQGRRERS